MFRWILLALGLLLIAGIWWWGVRRSRQASGNGQLRRSAPGPVSAPSTPYVTATEARNWGVPPFEPLNIRTADFESFPLVEVSMTAHAEAPPEPAASDNSATDNSATDKSATDKSATDKSAGPDDSQRIVTLRVCATGDMRWPGAELLAALEAHGLAFGRYHVFHRKHSDGQTLFCAASLVEPGTFDVAKMAEDEFRGLTLFAVLPGPLDAVHIVDSLIVTAEQLAQALQGVVQDSAGTPWSPQLAQTLREDAARTEAMP